MCRHRVHDGVNQHPGVIDHLDHVKDLDHVEHPEEIIQPTDYNLRYKTVFSCGICQLCSSVYFLKKKANLLKVVYLVLVVFW